MSLQTAFYGARSALAVNSAQTAIVSRNIAGMSEPGYARRLLLVDTAAGGEIRAGSIERATNGALRDAMLSATASSAASDAISSAVSSLQQTVGDPQSAQSPAALIGGLQTALTQAATAPQDPVTLGAAVDAAKTLATTLNKDSAQAQAARSQADSAMMQSVAQINSLLTEFGTVNAQIVAGARTGTNASDAADRRDSILTALAGQIGIKTVVGAKGDTAIYTDSGVPLFQESARMVSMTPTSTFAPGSVGKAVYVDGVSVAGASAAMPIKSGALAGLAQVRDVTAPTYQNQLDEIARGLIGAFAQTDQSGSSAPARTGLFAWSGAPSIPSGATSGLAAQISVDASVDPTAGGDATLLRDGGIGSGGAGPYVYNSSGAASFTGRLNALSAALDSQQTFNANSGLPAASSVSGLATNSVGWLESARKTASDASTQASAVAAQATSALSNATGVNMDDQMSQMLDLENTYQASAKMMATVDTMYSTLFTALTVTP